MNYKLQTKSIWTYPKKRFFTFLDNVASENFKKTLCVIGCADGTYVLPAAKRGFEVTAIDIDYNAIYGGPDIIIDGKAYKNIGLLKRLELEEDIKDKVEVFNCDFMEYDTSKKFSAIFTSGSLHYENNCKYTIEDLIEKIFNMLEINGTLLLEYIHRKANDESKRYFLTKDQVDDLFSKYPNAKIVSHKVKTYIEKPNSRDDTIHEISWGRIYVKKINEEIKNDK